jgi:O-antigen/teichoic acid export membrane protein
MTITRRLTTARTISLLSGATTSTGIFAVADQTVASASNFLTGVIIGRACAKEQFGLYILGLSIVLMVMRLQTSLISVPYITYSPRLKGSMHARYTGSTLIHQLILSTLSMLILAGGGGVLSLGLGPQYLIPVVWTLVVVITFILLRDNVRQICFAGLQMRTVLLLDSCVAVVQISGLLLLAYLGLLNVSLAYWVIGIACGISVLGWLISVRKSFAIQFGQVIPEFRRNWSLGKWIFASGSVWELTTHLHLWILTAFHDTSSAGVWAACHGIVALGNPVFMGGQNYIGPKISCAYANGGVVELVRLVRKVSVAFSLLISAFCVALLLFGGCLVALVYGEKYAGNGIVVSGLALNFLVAAVAFPFSRSLIALERPDLAFKASSVGLFILITVGFWLIQFFGTAGAAFGLMLGNLAGLAVRYFYYSKCVCSISKRK